MAVKFYAPTESDPGEIFVWREEGEEKVSLRIRRLPPAEERRIDGKHFGAKRRITYAAKGVQQDLDVEAQNKANVEKAAYCLVDSVGFDLEVAGPEAAARLSGLLNEKLDVGAVVRLDGRWTDALKTLVFAGLPDLVEFMGSTARKLRGEDAEAEEEAEGN